jgi:Ca2+/Na+ antiporter
MTWWERLKYAMVKPDGEPVDVGPPKDRSVDEIQADIAEANDKERAIGLIAAPIAALVGLVISSASIDYARTHHQSVTVDDELTYVLLGLSVLMLAMAWWRKRLFLGITVALYGLAVFNLHYWGFGVPFVMVGAWYLVRAYRLQQELKRATPAETARPRARTTGARPRSSKRYTPPT